MCMATDVYASAYAGQTVYSAAWKEPPEGTWSIDLQSTAADIVSCDIDGDGKEEFIAGTTDGRLIAIGTDASGKGVVRWGVEIGFALGSPVIADVDGDGFCESPRRER